MNPSELYDSVLVVDDERFVLRVTEQVLLRLGFKNVLVADNVAEALALVSTANPPVGLVLSDLNMPDADGLELLRQFDVMGYRGDILLFSGEDRQTLLMAESLARARKLSVIGSIEKPLQADELIDILSERKDMTQPSGNVPEEVDISPAMLEHAIQQNQIKPWFQPKIRIADKQPVGVEALARWPDSEYGPIYPGDFIPVAEKYGLIDQLTFSIIAQTAVIEKQWRDMGIELKIAVNLAMDSLYDEAFPDRMEMVIKNAGGDLGFLQLEVTETQLMEDLVRPLEALLRLRMKKIRLSIDDFGTGHSNLNQLRDLPFDELKLDRSYVHSSKGGPNQRVDVILASSVEMARKLNMTIVAEGVETLQDWERVEALACDQVQGYFCAKPMPAEEIPQWLEDWPTIRSTLFGD